MTTKKNILLVEDSAAHAQLILRALDNANLNYDVFVCENLQDARQAIQSNPPDILIADLNLPDGKGLELVASSKDENQYPLILMTSFGDETIAVDAMKAGAFDYIVKSPEVFEAMPRIVERVLREWEHIVAKQQAQQALLYKEHEQSEIFDSMVVAVVSIDETGIILTFNKSAEVMFGYSAQEIIGQNVNQLMPEPFASKHNSYLQNYCENGKSLIIDIGRNVDGLRKNKTTVPIHISVAELSESAQGKRRFIASCQDLTYAKHQEEKLRRSQKMEALGKLTGGIAHDYNNMLGVILGYAELLENGLSNKPELSEYVDNISHAARRGTILTKRLLSFSRHKKSETTVLNINALLEDQRLMLEKTLTARIQLIFDLEQKLWPTELDSGDLEDVIINLSINAMHAMGESGELTIQTRNEILSITDTDLLEVPEGKYVLLSVTDTGSGMEDETKEKIFDPFFTTKGDQGTGLGLSQVYGFVERSNGVVKVYSELGHGTRFTLFLPASDKEVTVSQTLAANTETDLQGTETILVVDDEPAMVNLAYKILSPQGYHVLTAGDGVQALEILKKENVDLIISDVIMPNMDGYQLVAYVQQHYPQIKIQMISGFGDGRHRNMVEDGPYHNLLNKPYTSLALLSRVRNLLNEVNANANISLVDRTILVMDDDEDTLKLFGLHLSRLGCKIIEACDGAGALELYQQSLQSGASIDAVILDLSIPGGMGGKEFAARVRDIDQNARLIVASGDSGGLVMTHYQDYGFNAALEKNFDREVLKLTLERVLA